jgi:hypothetical protein
VPVLGRQGGEKAGRKSERERERKNRCGDQRKEMASAEDKGALGRRKTEEKKGWNSPRTYAQFQKIIGTFL